MEERDREDKEFSFKALFVPLSSIKVIHFIIFIGLLVYCNNLFNGFVGDDNAQIVTNNLIHSLNNLPYFFRGSTFYIQEVNQNVGTYYRPFLSTSYALIYAVFGLNAFFFHLVQLLFHIINCIIIYLIFRKYFTIKIAFILSLVFLLHPINNEAVVNLANLQEELYAFFGLLSLKLLIERKSPIIIGLFFLGSLFSKESGIIFLPILLIYQFLFHFKTKNAGTKSLLTYLSLATTLYSLIRFSIGNLGFQTKLMFMTEQADFIHRLMTIPTILLYYLQMLVFPFHIANAWFWVVQNPTLMNFWGPIALEIVLTILLLLPVLRKKAALKLWKEYIFFLCLFLIALSITLQIIPLYVTVADRWFYMPLFGLLGIMGIGYQTYMKPHMKNKTFKIGLVVAIIVLISLYATRDFVRNFDWVDSYTLCQHDEKINTESFILEYCLGNEMYNRKDYLHAQTHAKKAVALFPKYYFSWYTLGKVDYALGDKLGAQQAFEKTLQYNNFSYGSQQLALTLVYEKKPKEAKLIAEKYLKKIPNSSELWYALALAEYELGNNDQAVAAAKKAFAIDQSSVTYKVYYRLSKHLPLSF